MAIVRAPMEALYQILDRRISICDIYFCQTAITDLGQSPASLDRAFIHLYYICVPYIINISFFIFKKLKQNKFLYLYLLASFFFIFVSVKNLKHSRSNN